MNLIHITPIVRIFMFRISAKPWGLLAWLPYGPWIARVGSTAGHGLRRLPLPGRRSSQIWILHQQQFLCWILPSQGHGLATAIVLLMRHMPVG